MPEAARNSVFVPAGMFAANGIIIGAWAAAIPGLAERLELSEARLAAVLLSFAIAGIAMMVATPHLIDRFGASRLALISGIAFATAPIWPLGAETWGAAIAGAGVLGLAHGAMDIAMNASAIEFERRLRRPILSRLHGCFSVGAMLGALLGGVLASLGLSPQMYAGGVTIVACAFLLPSLFVVDTQSRGAEEEHAAARPVTEVSRGTLASLAFVAFACLVAEGGMVDWLAKLMRGFGADQFIAAAVYSAFAGGMAAGRLAGDKLGTLFGDRRLVVGGASLSGCALAITLTSGFVGVALPLMFVAGLGVANIVPVVFRASAAVGRSPAASLAFVTACGYAGFLAGPPSIGMAAEASGLRVALFIVVVGLAATACIASVGLRRGIVSIGDEEHV